MTMKYTKFLLTLFIIFQFALFSQNATAQTAKTKPKLITKAELDKREVKKFAASFIKALDETKDLNEVSSDFFVKDFKIRFIKECPSSDIDPDVYNKLDETRRQELNTTFFNVGYLGLMYGFSKIKIDKIGETDEDNNIESIENLIPTPIIGLVKNSKTLNPYVFRNDDEDDFIISDIDILQDFLADLKNLAYAQRMFLNDQSADKKTKFDQTIKELRKAANWYSTKICLKDCDDFPDNTRIFELRFYPLYFKMVKENGAFRIFDLYIEATD